MAGVLIRVLSRRSSAASFRAPVATSARGFSTRDFLKKVDNALVEDKDPKATRAALADGSEEEISQYKTMLGGCTRTGFLVNDTELKGSVLALPRSTLLWRASRFEDVSVESLALLPLIEPRIEILLIGSGETVRRPNEEIVAHYRSLGVVVEQMTTLSAIGQFNIMNSEDRLVAAALLHPSADPGAEPEP